MYTTILDYTNGTTIIINTPVLDDDSKLEEFLKEKYKLKDFYYMVHNNLNIDL